jgi:hypothetical protein
MRREITAEELQYFYMATGEALWHLQYVEDALCKFYIICCIHFQCEGVTRDNATKKMDGIKKKTLGQLIGLLEKTKYAPNEMLADLKSFNNERKWIVHNSMRDNGNDLYTDQGRNDFTIKPDSVT